MVVRCNALSLARLDYDSLRKLYRPGIPMISARFFFPFHHAADPRPQSSSHTGHESFFTSRQRSECLKSSRLALAEPYFNEYSDIPNTRPVLLALPEDASTRLSKFWKARRAREVDANGVAGLGRRVVFSLQFPWDQASRG